MVEETIYGEIETQTQTGYISNILQDVVYGHHRWIFINFLKGIYLKGIYMEIDDLLAADPPSDYDDIYPSVLAGNRFEGRSFNLPETVHPGGSRDLTVHTRNGCVRGVRSHCLGVSPLFDWPGRRRGCTIGERIAIPRLWVTFSSRQDAAYGHGARPAYPGHAPLRHP